MRLRTTIGALALGAALLSPIASNAQYYNPNAYHHQYPLRVNGVIAV